MGMFDPTGGLLTAGVGSILGGGDFFEPFKPPKPPKPEEYAAPPAYRAPQLPADTPISAAVPSLRSPLLANPQQNVLESPAMGLDLEDPLKRAQQSSGGFAV